MSAFFVTATGTDIGKTFLTAGLVAYARQKGETASAAKPVISGYMPGETSDLDALAEAMGLPAQATHDLADFHFKAPLSPDVAARQEGREIDPQTLINKSRTRIKKAQDSLFLMEGVGGSHVPLAPNFLVADWIAALQIPAILVSSDYLGSLSHTLTAWEALKARHIPVATIILSQAEEPAMDIEDTVKSLRQQEIHAPILPLSRNPQKQSQNFAAIWSALKGITS